MMGQFDCKLHSLLLSNEMPTAIGPNMAVNINKITDVIYDGYVSKLQFTNYYNLKGEPI
jgi:hypothetical protein